MIGLNPKKQVLVIVVLLVVVAVADPVPPSKSLAHCSETSWVGEAST